jgi:hypothetical protein
LSSLAWAGEFSGQLKSSTDDYPDNLGPGTSMVVPYVTLEMSQKYKLRRSLRFQWKVFALTNLSSKSQPENYYGDVPEAFFEYKKGVSKTKIGMNTVNWGVVDVSSPSDTINTQAIFDPMRTSRQGAPMIDESIGGEAFSLDLIYIPVQRAPQLPSKDSRWLPRDVLINIPFQTFGDLQIPKNMQYEYMRPDTETHALNNNYGAKLSSHLGSLDVQVTAFEGASPSPKLRPQIVTISNVLISPLVLQPVYYRVRTTGVGFVYASEKWIFRGESSYQQTLSQDELLQPWMWSNVLGLETNLDLGSSTMTVLAQYYYSKNPQAADNLIASNYRIFDHTAVAGIRWAYSETLTINLSGVYETGTNGLFAMAGFDQKLTDHLTWGLSWKNFSAEQEGLIKTYAKNSHGTLDMTYFF